MFKKLVGLIILGVSLGALAAPVGKLISSAPDLQTSAPEIPPKEDEPTFVIDTYGGLGNRMFLLAGQFTYAKHFNKKMCLKNPFHKAFHIPIPLCSKEEIQKAQKKSCSFNRFSPLFFQKDDCLFISWGYMQDIRFFEEEEKNVKKMFQFAQSLPLNTTALANLIRRKNSVAVHIRRTDYTHSPEIYPLMPLDYYEKGADYIQGKSEEDIHLFVFSDDTAWVKKNFKSRYPFTIVGGNTAATDLQLMSLCRHNIIANSTFSWWGAYLNRNPDKIVVAPSVWNLKDKWWREDIILKDWVTMPVNLPNKDEVQNAT